MSWLETSLQRISLGEVVEPSNTSNRRIGPVVVVLDDPLKPVQTLADRLSGPVATPWAQRANGRAPRKVPDWATRACCVEHLDAFMLQAGLRLPLRPVPCPGCGRTFEIVQGVQG